MIEGIKSMQGAFDLTGKNALVTGGSRGLGAAIALAFAECGANVALSSRSGSSKTLEELAPFGNTYKEYKADVAKYDDCKELASAVNKDFGQIDILVNNAGISGLSDFLDDDNMEIWHSVLNTNLGGVANMTHTVGNYMREAGKGGCIINISSIAGSFIVRTQNMAWYSTSKAGIDMFTKCMAYELAKYDIRVNCIAPGFTHSDLSDTIPQGGIDYLCNTIVTGRFNEALEIGAMAVYLASPAAACMTGVVIPMNGGHDLSV